VKIQGTYSFEAPLETVWAALFDPEVLAKTLPGCEKLEREGDQFKGEINVKMGPVQGKFQGKVDITDVLSRESYTMVIDGRGPAGFVKATAQLRVKPDAAAGAATRLEYDSDVQVGGRIASVGQRLLDASSRAIVKQSLEGLHEQIKALAARTREANLASMPSGAEPGPAAPHGSAAPEGVRSDPVASEQVHAGEAPRRAALVPPAVRAAAAPRPPARGVSQAAFAMGVAKEVTKELFPIRTVLLVLGVVILAWAIYQASRSG
jgi:carbon monoxide dehydrogenase subunit G